MRLTEITDDLTGAADSGSYFTARGRKVRICTNGRCSLEHETDEILTVNLSSRNTAQDKARQLHADLLRRLEPGGFYMKKIGTGFRGNDSYELDGLLDGWPDYNVFIVDNAPDLGTFTLYGNQYCEGEILPKSVYANDPIFPPTESYIPKILGKDTDKKIHTDIAGIALVAGAAVSNIVQIDLCHLTSPPECDFRPVRHREVRWWATAPSLPAHGHGRRRRKHPEGRSAAWG